MLDNSMPCVPDEYLGREQTYLKHRVLKLYLESWAHKMCSHSKYSDQPVRLWYIDCFAGPWRSANEDLRDTSTYIGLNALAEASKTWRGWNYNVSVGAIFVEKDPNAYTSLRQFLDNSDFIFPMHAIQGEFGQQVPNIQKLIGNDPAFLFVDPTGWTGAALKFIKPLVIAPRRDVMVNVMYDYINRFKGSSDREIRRQIAEFFDTEVPINLNEDKLFELYRKQLKKVCGVKYAADLIIQDPVKDRTKFRLVVGGDHSAVLSLFRDVEKKVIEKEGPLVRSAAKQKSRQDRMDQGTLFNTFESIEIDNHCRRREKEIGKLKATMLALGRRSGKPFRELIPDLLEAIHLTVPEIRKFIWSWYKEKLLILHGVKKSERSLKDHHVIENIEVPVQSDA